MVKITLQTECQILVVLFWLGLFVCLYEESADLIISFIKF